MYLSNFHKQLLKLQRYTYVRGRDLTSFLAVQIITLSRSFINLYMKYIYIYITSFVMNGIGDSPKKAHRKQNPGSFSTTGFFLEFEGHGPGSIALQKTPGSRVYKTS
jgi:hypothetical protein